MSVTGGRVAAAVAVLAAFAVAACASATPSAPSVAPLPSGATEVTITTAPGDDPSYAPDVVEVNGGGPIAVTLVNASTQPHNVAFTGAITVASETIVAPGATDTFEIGSPEPGSYPFVCTIHPGMNGTLVVTASG